jgi:hypothetical protein
MAPLAGVSVSHQWIDSLIWGDKVGGGDLWRHLRQPKRRLEGSGAITQEHGRPVTKWHHGSMKPVQVFLLVASSSSRRAASS